jgi:hypothetical protein
MWCVNLGKAGLLYFKGEHSSGHSKVLLLVACKRCKPQCGLAIIRRHHARDHLVAHQHFEEGQGGGVRGELGPVQLCDPLDLTVAPGAKGLLSKRSPVGMTLGPPLAPTIVGLRYLIPFGSVTCLIRDGTSEVGRTYLYGTPSDIQGRRYSQPRSLPTRTLACW